MSTSPARITLLHNPGASGNRRRAAPTAETCGNQVDIVILDDLERLTDQLAGIALKNCDLLIIDGGDGTVREVVSRLPEIFDEPPVIGIMAHGNTNLVARKLGRLSDIPDLTCAQVAAQSKPAPVLRIDNAAPRILRGFIAGWGAYAAGTRIAVDEIAARGTGQVWRAIVATMRRALFGAEGRKLRQGQPGSIVIQGGIRRDGPTFLGMATVLEMPLTPGIAPFWGGGDGALRWLDIPGAPRWLMLAALPVLTGRPMKWMAGAGYRSGRSSCIRLTIAGGLVLDGEIIETDSGRPLEITANETLRILADPVM